jgi:tRNA nucleotidyltransferase (CCA-adding enzyme)
MDIFRNLDVLSQELLRSIGQLAQELDMKAYLVGGPVRDLFLGKKTQDIDVTVVGNGIRLAQAFAKSKKAVIVPYPAFGTATVTLADGRLVDFATARKERYSRPGAFPAVSPADLRNDLYRRDFTINAMAISINPTGWGKLVDPFKGRADLGRRRIRVLHQGSFCDDPTRIVRAARFLHRFGFTMERKTMAWLKQALAQQALDTIKPQRYQKEYRKILKENDPRPALKCLKDWGALHGGTHATHGKSK